MGDGAFSYTIAFTLVRASQRNNPWPSSYKTSKILVRFICMVASVLDVQSYGGKRCGPIPQGK